MHVYLPENWNGLLVCCDVRNKKDRELQRAEGGCPVLEFWPFQRALPSGEWARTARIALWDNGEQVAPRDGLTGKELTAARRAAAQARSEAKSSLVAWCRTHKPKCVAVLQSRSQQARGSKLLDEEGEAEGVDGTVCWGAFDAPESLPAMAGTVFQSPLGPVIGIFNPVNYEFVYGALVQRWLVRGLDVALGNVAPPPQAVTELGPELDEALKSMLRSTAPVAVDIETFTDKDLITCIGLAQGELAVSVAWDSFVPHGQSVIEAGAGAETRKLVARILAGLSVKYLHNGVAFDVPKLEARGLPVGGRVLDTMIMFGLVYRQFPKGLQAAVAAELPCPPWKSLHRAGKDLDDARAWIQNPAELRGYNAQDAYWTLKLGDSVAWKAGQKI